MDLYNLGGKNSRKIKDDVLYVLAIGQSNMARTNSSGTFGQASNGVYPSRDRVSILNTSSGLVEPWDMTTVDQNEGIGDKRGAATFEVSTIPYHFAIEAARRTGQKVVVIASSDGGESLDFWGLNTAGDTHTATATGWVWILEQTALVPRVDLVLFHQGETLGSRTLAQQKAGLELLFSTLRAITNIGDASIIGGELATASSVGNLALREIVNTRSVRDFLLVSRPAGTLLDSVHFTDNQIADFGVSYCDAFVKNSAGIDNSGFEVVSSSDLVVSDTTEKRWRMTIDLGSKNKIEGLLDFRFQKVIRYNSGTGSIAVAGDFTLSKSRQNANTWHLSSVVGTKDSGYGSGGILIEIDSSSSTQAQVLFRVCYPDSNAVYGSTCGIARRPTLVQTDIDDLVASGDITFTFAEETEDDALYQPGGAGVASF